MLGTPATSNSNRPSHQPSAFSVDLDIEGGGSIDERYDTGLIWPLGSSNVPTSWSAKGPADHIPRLSFIQSVRQHVRWAASGWWDANRWPDALKLISSSTELRTRVIKGLLLSGTISAIVFFFELAFFPKILFQQPVEAAQELSNSGSLFGSLGNVFWLYPLIGGSYLLASSWTADIAQAAYKIRHGHVKNLSLSNPSLPPATSKRLISESYRVILIVNYTILYILLGRIPVVGSTLAFLFMSLVDGYYCFEQVWISRGWSLERRMRYCEERWSYFVAFGLPSTAVSFFHPSGLLNLMLFMLVFPFCSVLAMLASPQPRISASGSTAAASGLRTGLPGSDAPAPLSRLVPSRLPIFWPTIALHRIILRTMPNLTDSSPNVLTKAYDRTSDVYRGMYGAVSAGNYGVNGGNRGFASGGKTAAQMVGGIFGDVGGRGSNGSSGFGSGRASPVSWPSSRLAPNVNTNHPNTNQNIYNRGPNSAGANQPDMPIAPPPRGPAANHRKAD